MSWETVIGLEVHVQLKTSSKLFCPCSTVFGEAPNTNVCPVCLALPGALPVINRRAVEMAVQAALALGCSVNETNRFARKSYFYPDLPKGYQISQFDIPVAVNGHLDIQRESGNSRIGITRIHLEDDAGKSIHDRVPDATLIDLNRAGVPLIEIVSEPEIASPEMARAYLVTLKQILEYLDVSDCNMEEGSLRADANLSVRKPGDPLGTKQEIKNLNSFSAVEKALAELRERQVAMLENGNGVKQATFSGTEAGLKELRTKEESTDYRYFSDPDLPPLVVDPGTIRSLEASMPELPGERKARFADELGLSGYEAEVLTATRTTADYFERVMDGSRADPSTVAGWVMNEVIARWNDGVEVPVGHLVELIGLVDSGELSRRGAKKVLDEIDGRDPDPVPAIVSRLDLRMVSDSRAIEAWVDETLTSHPDEVARAEAGETKLVDFLVGHVMKLSRGKADPGHVRAMIEDRLDR